MNKPMELSNFASKVRRGLYALVAIFPQDASGDLSLTPFSSRLCNWCSLICLVMAAIVHTFYEYAETLPLSQYEDPFVQWFVQLTATLSWTGVCYESCLAFASKGMGLDKVYQEDLTFRRRLRLNRKMLAVFTILATLYTLMSSRYHILHKGWLAEHHGGVQIVYSFRFVEWVFCSPIVFSVSGQLDHAPDGSPRNALIPSSMLTGIYCLISWQGLVVKDVWAGWALVIFAFLSFFVAAVEQLVFAWYIKDHGRAGPLRAGLLIYLVVMVGIYGIFYLLPIPGWISPRIENSFYCVGDASFKLGTSIMLLATNDLANNEEMRERANATIEDLTRLIDGASVPIIGVDSEARITQWNQKTASLTAFSEEQAKGVSLVSMMGNACQAAGENLIRKALAKEDAGTVEASILPPCPAGQLDSDGAPKKAMMVLSAAPRQSKFGVVTGATLIGCDMTEVKSFREAEERKTRLMAVVSHELRSPLHGIVGLIDRLNEDEEDPMKARFLGLVRNCATRLLDLVINIMDMASMVASSGDGKSKNQQRLWVQPVDLTKVIDETITLTRNAVDKRGNTLVQRDVELRNTVEDLPTIEADAHKIAQVMHNIITNACKFTKKGQITVSSNVDPQGQWIEVSVADTGKGIARHALERIFRPFEQEDNSESRHHDGVGLGLAIAQEVVHRHAGQIRVESDLGVGTTFIVRLPVNFGESAARSSAPEASPGDTPKEKAATGSEASKAEEAMTEQKDHEKALTEQKEHKEAPAEQKEHEETSKSGSDKPSILIVDDDDEHNKLLQEFLSEFEVQVAKSGVEAMMYLKAADKLPDLMLLDAVMPGISGYEVCLAVRNKMRITQLQLPIVMVSASRSDEGMIQAFEIGCNDYIVKPIQRALFLKRIRTVLMLKLTQEAEIRAAREPTNASNLAGQR